MALGTKNVSKLINPFHFRIRRSQRVLSSLASMQQIKRSNNYSEYFKNFQENKAEVFRERYFFQEDDKIGEGFFSEVFEATDRVLGRKVAIKRTFNTESSYKTASQELKVMKQIKSRMACQEVHLLLHQDCFSSEDGCTSFVFDLCSGGDMFDEVTLRGVFSEADVRNLLHSLVPTLNNLHKNGFLHRDIKLENLLLDCQRTRFDRLNSVVLSDFGYARCEKETDKFSNIAGTYGYVAPEALSSRLYSPKSDVWSLGVVLFSAVAGFLPFPHVSTVESGKDYAYIELEAIRHGSSDQTWEKEMTKPCFAEKSPEFKNLLRSMLTPYVHDRISLDEVMDHPFMLETQQILQSSG